MLFHNRPVKAVMGSVIVNGGVQLSGGKRLVDTKLYILRLDEDKLADMTDAQVIDLLHADGKLCKRPFLLTEDFGFVGFKEELWSEKI